MDIWKNLLVLSVIVLSLISVYNLYQLLLLTGEMGRYGMVYESDVNKKAILIFITVFSGWLGVLGANKYKRMRGDTTQSTAP